MTAEIVVDDPPVRFAGIVDLKMLRLVDPADLRDVVAGPQLTVDGLGQEDHDQGVMIALALVGDHIDDPLKPDRQPRLLADLPKGRIDKGIDKVIGEVIRYCF